MLTIAVACDSGNSCRLHEAVIGQFETLDFAVQIAIHQLKLREICTLF